MQIARIKLLGISVVVALLSVMGVGHRSACPAAAEQAVKDEVQPELIVRDRYNM